MAHRTRFGGTKPIPNWPHCLPLHPWKKLPLPLSRWSRLLRRNWFLFLFNRGIFPLFRKIIFFPKVISTITFSSVSIAEIGLKPFKPMTNAHNSIKNFRDVAPTIIEIWTDALGGYRPPGLRRLTSQQKTGCTSNQYIVPGLHDSVEKNTS